MSTNLDNETIQQAKSDLEVAEKSFGMESQEVLDCLERLGKVLRQQKRALDAANVEARAALVRKKLSPEPVVPASTKNEPTVSERKCPFCAESIKAEAVICRFCNRSIRSNSKAMKIPIAVGLVLVIGISLGWFGLTFAHKDSSNISGPAKSNIFSAVAPKAKIVGAAWVVKGAGQSDIQRGMEIALLNTEGQTALTNAGQASDADFNAKYEILGGYYRVENSLRAMRNAIKPDYVVQTAKTDVDGKFELSDVPVGSYYLYATYHTDFSVAYWLIPVTVESGTELKVNLDNSNMSECQNKKD